MDRHLFAPRLFLLIAVGGVAGTLARYGIQLLLQARGGSFPWGTLIVNLAGGFAFGFVIRYLTNDDVAATQLRIALTVGFCGAFTTMSSFSYESLVLLETGKHWAATMYLVASISGSLASTAGGLLLAQSLRSAG